MSSADSEELFLVFDSRRSTKSEVSCLSKPRLRDALCRTSVYVFLYILRHDVDTEGYCAEYPSS